MLNDYIYEDDDIIVCHKSAGIATEGASVGRMDLVSSVRNYLARKGRDKSKTGKPPYVGTVYRLDKDVEGIVILAKNKAAASDLAKQIKEHSTEKYYYALCCGIPRERTAHITDYIARREDTGLAVILDSLEAESAKNGLVTLKSGETIRLIAGDVKRAELEYELVAVDENKSLLKIRLLTGRFHQIRAQLSAMGHPVLGDSKYGNIESRTLSSEMKINNICLVCYRYSFKHPGTGKEITFEITPDNSYINEVLEG